jgi:glycerol-3-phosphate O-acyltransferase
VKKKKLALARTPSVEEMSRRLAQRLRNRLESLPDKQILSLVEDTVYQERLRFEEFPSEEEERALVDRAARAALGGGRQAWLSACDALVRSYAAEIHNRFSERAYGLATRVLPGSLIRLVTATDPRRLVSRDFDPDSRLIVGGELETLRAISERGTFILTPTHLSNLDSPLLGYSLYNAGLPPVAYGAGLNLFSNPVMSFWMSRLGAYTVDRRKQGRLYKETLKDYSVELLRLGVHQLFFPGGTRSRSGTVEKKLKKGLLGTGLTAWQENLDQGVADPDIFVVPCTLSTSLVLEAETLVSDALARQGKSRYIITDDEFSRPRDVASFLSRVLNLDESIHLTFSRPMDLMGNYVDAGGNSLGPGGEVIDRRRYVTDPEGRVQWDPQRDRIYTDRLSDRIVDAFHRDNVALPTHVAAFAAWEWLAREHPLLDIYHLVRIDGSQRRISRQALLGDIEVILSQIDALEQRGRIRSALPGGAREVLETAIRHFDSFHTRDALVIEGDEVVVDMELAWFYRNRLLGYDLGRGGAA